MGWIWCVRCEKYRRDFVARTFALVRPVLHRVSYGNQMVPNVTKWYETHQNKSLGSNGVDRVRSLRKIPILFRGMNFCTSSARFPPTFVRQPNCPNCTETHQNMSLGSNGWIGCVHCETFRRDFVARTFALVRPVFHRDS